ncbi:MAG: FtsQ-type POTRA domain-containing protein [Nitrospirae bacterium]|nr:FtsQ-type POTRA domain-containing protein [Nitrospirota bacterium]
MYFSKYKSKKTAGKKNRIRGQKRGGVKKGVLRFLILAAIIISIVPVVYLSDSVYRLAAKRPDNRQAVQTSYMDRHFRVESVRVSGNNMVTMEELNPYLQSAKGRNILKLDLGVLAAKLRNNPWIKDVSVRREPPSSIAVSIVERTPAVYVNSRGGLYLADEEGTLLGEKGGITFGLPVVYGISLGSTRVGEKSNSEALMSAIRVRNELSSLSWIELPQTAIEIDERSDITLHMRGYRVKLGHNRYRDKMLRFNEIAKDLNGKGISYKEVDLRFDNQVVVQTL